MSFLLVKIDDLLKHMLKKISLLAHSAAYIFIFVTQDTHISQVIPARNKNTV